MSKVFSIILRGAWDFLIDIKEIAIISFIIFGITFFPARMYFPLESYGHVHYMVSFLRELVLGDTLLTRPVDYFVLNQLDGISFGFFVWACWAVVKRSCRRCWINVCAWYRARCERRRGLR